MAAAPTINGDMPSSQFLHHLVSYPVVSDSIDMYKSNPYGAKSLHYADSGYAHFVKPVLPYAQRPYALVSPYLSRADQLASSGLDKVDATFPIITKDTNTLKNTAISYVTFPVRKADETRSYVFSTYSQQYQRHGGQGVFAGGKALISTGLTVSSDFLAAVTSYLGQTKAQVETKVQEKKQN